ncbi:MAG: T9SS C-terminal target domain-containing protein [Calditrichaeota bacterium]|nr:MAG: T9SS C-terminal target domain-containing protein [Calditrichota bacterium]
MKKTSTLILTIAFAFISQLSFGQVYKAESQIKANTTTASFQTAPKIAMNRFNNFVVVWESEGNDGDGFGIYGKIYSNKSIPITSEFLVNTTTSGNQVSPSVARRQLGKFVVTWMSENQDGSGWGVYAQVYHNSGSKQGSEFLVNTSTTGHQRNPVVAMDDSGSFVIAWQEVALDGSSFSIKGKHYDKDNNLTVDEFQINTSSSSFLGYPAIAIEDDGAYVVVWQSLGTDGSGHGIYGQRFNNASVKQGSEFLINTTTAGNQTSPSVDMATNGDFVVSWTSSGQDGDQGGIYAKRFLSNGTANGSEFQVSTTTAGNQDNSQISVNLDADFTIAWDSYGQDGSFTGVYLQSYNSDGTTNGNETPINGSKNNFQQKVSVAQYQNSKALIAVWQDGLNNSTATLDGEDYGIYFQRFRTSATSGGTEYALEFDGDNDRVKVDGYKGIIGTDARSGEAWIKTGTSSGIIVAWGLNSSDNRWLLRICQNNGLVGALELNVYGSYIVGSTVVTDNKWHHVAFTFENDGTPRIEDAKLYVDGELEVISTTNASAVDFSTVSNDDLKIGKGFSGDTFNGMIDEFRLWSDVRTQSEIRENMNKILNGDEFNLELYYRFNNSTGSILTDISPNGRNASLVNMANDDWVVSSIPLGETSETVNYNAQTNIGDSGKQMKVRITSTPDASNFLNVYKSGEGNDVVNSGENFPAGVLQRSNILWGIKEFGDVTTDLEFDYNSIVGAENPATLKVLKRSTPTDDWTDVTSDFTNDTNAKTFSGTGFTTFSQFSIGGGEDNPLPVSLNSFSAEGFEKAILLNWSTESEVENKGFILERKNENSEEIWREIASYKSHKSLKGQEFSSSETKYSFADSSVTFGQIYEYRISDESLTGEVTIHSETVTASLRQIGEIENNLPKEFSVSPAYPNPFNPTTTISYALPKDTKVSIVIYNILGKEIRTLVNGSKSAGFYNAQWNGLNNQGTFVGTGVYFVKVEAGIFSKVIKLTMLK